MARPKFAAMHQGRDPKLTVPQRQLASMTVAQVLEDYLETASKLRPTTVRNHRATAKHFGPLLNRIMRDISPEEFDRQFRATFCITRLLRLASLHGRLIFANISGRS
jgi:hypothetical protein